MNEIKAIKCKFCIDEFPSILLVFNGHHFNYSHLSNMWDIHKADTFIEFLPGVFYKEEPTPTRNIWTEKISHLLKFVSSKLKLPLPRNWKKAFFITLHFQIANYRDSIYLSIDNIVQFNNEEVWDDQQDIDQYFDFKASKDFTISFDRVPTDKILYPFTPGGSGSRCRIMGIFYRLSLLDDEYPFFTKHEMFYTSSQSQTLLDECRKFDSCMQAVESYQNGTYLWPTKDSNNSDNFRLVERDGIYKISNANHRVCCAKRFGVPWIQAQVVHYIAAPAGYQDPYTPSKSFAFDDENQRILKGYYSTLKSCESVKLFL